MSCIKPLFLFNIIKWWEQLFKILHGRYFQDKILMWPCDINPAHFMVTEQAEAGFDARDVWQGRWDGLQRPRWKWNHHDRQRSILWSIPLVQTCRKVSNDFIGVFFSGNEWFYFNCLKAWQILQKVKEKQYKKAPFIILSTHTQPLCHLVYFPLVLPNRHIFFKFQTFNQSNWQSSLPVSSFTKCLTLDQDRFKRKRKPVSVSCIV